MLKLFDDAIYHFQSDVKEHHPLREQMTIKAKVHVRISNLPLNAETTKGTDHPPRCDNITHFNRTQQSLIRYIIGVLPKSSDIGSLLAVRGTVIRTGLAKMLEVIQRELIKNIYILILRHSGRNRINALDANLIGNKKPTLNPLIHFQFQRSV